MKKILVFLLAILIFLFSGCSENTTKEENDKVDAMVVKNLTDMPQGFVINGLFCDNAVLQCDKKVPVWGFGVDGQRIIVEIDGQKKECTVSEGEWRVNLEPMKASFDKKELKVTCDDCCIVFENILIGEVFLAAGQSNMEMMVNGVFPEDYDEAKKNPNEHIREFTVEGKTSRDKLDQVEGIQWREASEGNVGMFSATAYFTAVNLYKELDVPIGILNSSLGGTKIESWISYDTLNGKRAGKAYRRNNFNQYINPIVPYSVRGILWYQGCANVIEESQKATYEKTFEVYCQSYRELFEDKNLPIAVVQLVQYNGIPEEVAGWSNFRMVQANLMKKMNGVYTAITIDMGDPNDIHPKDKKKLGDRLARLVLNTIFNKTDIDGLAPIAISARLDGVKAIVEFENVTEKLEIKSDVALDAQVCDNNNNWYDANVELSEDGKGLYFSSNKVTSPTAVRYCDKAVTTVSIYETTGLPVCPFNIEVK